MRRSTGWISARAAFVSLALAALGGCGFGVPLKKATLTAEQAQRSATIHLGESTRAEVRAALGEPWLRSRFWRVEAYRADDKRTELGFAVAVVVPVPIGVFSEKQHGYVLVTYDASGRVSQVSSGMASEGFLAEAGEKWLAIRADEITFAVDLVRTKLRSTLLADSSRLPGYLAERRQAAGCTLVAVCAEDQGCPDEVSVDDGEPFDPSPITALCGPDAPCPKGSPLAASEVDGKKFFRVPVLHAIGVAPGRHRVRMASSVIPGSGEASFECASGDVLYGVVVSRVEGASWWSKGKLQAIMTLTAAAPETWEPFSLVLHRNNRWLVDPGPDAD
jgi:hypothetical protein